MTSAMRRLRAARRLGSLTGRDLMRVVRAQWYLLTARLAVVVKARGRLLARTTGDAAPHPEDAARVRQVSLAVARAAEYGLFRPTCLVRSIA